MLLKAILRVVDAFYSKAVHKKAYERDIIVTVKLKYTDSRRKEVEKLLPNILKYVSINKL